VNKHSDEKSKFVHSLLMDVDKLISALMVHSFLLSFRLIAILVITWVCWVQNTNAQLTPDTTAKPAWPYSPAGLDTTPVNLFIQTDIELLVSIDGAPAVLLPPFSGRTFLVGEGNHEIGVSSPRYEKIQAKRTISTRPAYYDTLWDETDTSRTRFFVLTRYYIDTVVVELKDQLPPMAEDVTFGRFDVIKYLLDNGADPNQVDKDGNPLIILAAIGGYKEILKELLDHKANPNKAGKANYTALIYAAKRGEMEPVKMLLDYNADVNARSSDGRFPLFYGVINNNAEMTRLLLSKGARPNERDSDGRSPLMRAAEYGYLECAQVLVEYKANVNIRDAEGNTPLTLATKKGNTKLEDYLKEKGGR
jgi:hypothetical protein